MSNITVINNQTPANNLAIAATTIIDSFDFTTGSIMFITPHKFDANYLHKKYGFITPELKTAISTFSQESTH